MKRFVSRITLVALVAATCTPMAHPVFFTKKDGKHTAIIGAMFAAASAAGLWYVNQRQTQHNADLAEYNAINRALSILETEEEQKPAFCKLEGQDKAARRAYYVQNHCEGMADREELDHVHLNAMIAEKKDRQAALWQSLDKYKSDESFCGTTLVIGSLAAYIGLMIYCSPIN